MRGLLFAQPRVELIDIASQILRGQLNSDWHVISSYQKNIDQWLTHPSHAKVIKYSQLGDTATFGPSTFMVMDQVQAHSFYTRPWVQELIAQSPNLLLIDYHPFIHCTPEQLQRFTHLYIGKVVIQNKIKDFYARFLTDQKTLTEADFIAKVLALTDRQYYQVERNGRLTLHEFTVPTHAAPTHAMPAAAATPVPKPEDHKFPATPVFFSDSKAPQLPDSHQDIWISLHPNKRVVVDVQKQLLLPISELKQLNTLVGDADVLSRAVYENVSPDEVQLVFRLRKTKFDLAVMLLLTLLNRFREQKLVTMACITMK